MDATKTMLVGHAFTAAQAFVAGVSRPKTRELSSDLGRKDFGFSHEEFAEESGFYEGTFKVKHRNGFGVLYESNSGTKYRGQFMHDKRHNHGLQTWADSSSYDGEWVHGAKHGTGSYKTVSDSYAGKWEEGFKHGHGHQVFENKDEYVGSFWKGQCSGPGVYYHADGSEYHGAYANGKRNGVGMYFGPKQQKEHHTYKQGILVQRDILWPGSKPPRGQRAIQPMHSDQLVAEQKQLDMIKDTVFDNIPYMGHLCVKDSSIMDLSAPSIRKSLAAVNMAEMKAGLYPFEGSECSPVSGSGPVPLHPFQVDA
ncbi:unnamed protein product [Effrenium voratum]|uniref:Uncharacterized protein n=1 Tax=Effrenium voratum TaxID=2562239 RepID=A0AA36IS24_9DINO|nr:unnamed protein product [Effrenium voratum]CAJ1391865.1 unnamed protein product [Effrenium voratum]CAJ1442252.1 unnamed protein product [Effrenium voratum]